MDSDTDKALPGDSPVGEIRAHCRAFVQWVKASNLEPRSEFYIVSPWNEPATPFRKVQTRIDRDVVRGWILATAYGSTPMDAASLRSDHGLPLDARCPKYLVLTEYEDLIEIVSDNSSRLVVSASNLLLGDDVGDVLASYSASTVERNIRRLTSAAGGH